MRYRCKNCGNEFSEKFPFCPHCGTQMVYPEERVVECEAEVEAYPVTNKNEQSLPKPKFHILSILGFAFGIVSSSCNLTYLFSQFLPDGLRSALEILASANSISLCIIGLIFSIIGLKKSRNKVFGIIGICLNGSTIVGLVVGFLIGLAGLLSVFWFLAAFTGAQL